MPLTQTARENPLVSVNLAVFNGEKYLPFCLASLGQQTYQNLEINVWDNNSTDHTKKILLDWRWLKPNLFRSKTNLGMWPAHEKLFKVSHGQYLLVLSVDIILHPEAIAQAVKIMESDLKIGALQKKIYQFALAAKDQKPEVKLTQTIDTVGFKLERSRRVINLGHGEEDRGQFDLPQEVFGVEGAAPFFRLKALRSCFVNKELVDKDMFWYGDDFDLAWRMRLFGWKQFYHPAVIAYHDRSTTKGLSQSLGDYWRRLKIRRQIPLHKRRLDWRNKRLARIKNDFGINVFQDLPWILKREVLELIYIILVEPAVLLEVPKLIKLIPKFWQKRRAVMAKARVSPQEMRLWIR